VAPLARVAVEAEGEMPGTQPGKTLPFAEVTGLSEDETLRLHVWRIVEHEGQWYVLVLTSYPRFI
ncbi:MAG: hypothetical protein C4523_06395, partial [Myxococcales bacterium]